MSTKASRKAARPAPSKGVKKKRQGIPLTEHTYTVLQELRKLEGVGSIEELMVELIRLHPKGSEVDTLVTKLERLRGEL